MDKMLLVGYERTSGEQTKTVLHSHSVKSMDNALILEPQRLPEQQMCIAEPLVVHFSALFNKFEQLQWCVT